MTDSSQLLPNSVAVSSDALFNLKPSSVRCRSYRASIPTSNKSSFSPGDLAIFYIPGGRRSSYLDPQQSYLRFTVLNNDTVANNFFNVDNNASCFINRIDIFHASNLLESIQQYNVLFAFLFDFMFTSSAKLGMSSAYGCGDSIATQPRQGMPIYDNQRLTFTVPLLSGTIGLGCDKLVPIGALADDIRIELTWEQQAYAVVYNAAPNFGWTIIQAELELTIIELSDEGESMVQSVSPYSSPVFLHGNSYRHYVSNLAANITGGVSFLVPARFASLKTLILCPRRATEANSQLAYSISSRANPQIATYWWRVGSYIIPNKYITLQNANTTGSYSEAFMELTRSFHALTAPQYASGLTAAIYNTGDVVDATIGGLAAGGVIAIQAGAASYNNGFGICQELESWAGRSDVIISGINTLSSQVFFEANLQNVGPATNYQLDFFANYDHILVLENGILSARF